MRPTTSGTFLHVLISDIEVRLFKGKLHDLLRSRGIDPTQPYTQRDRPDIHMHEFIQERQYTYFARPSD